MHIPAHGFTLIKQLSMPRSFSMVALPWRRSAHIIADSHAELKLTTSCSMLATEWVRQTTCRPAQQKKKCYSYKPAAGRPTETINSHSNKCMKGENLWKFIFMVDYMLMNRLLSRKRKDRFWFASYSHVRCVTDEGTWEAASQVLLRKKSIFIVVTNIDNQLSKEVKWN